VLSLTALLCLASVALAAAPETPGLTVETLVPGGPTAATTATFHGVIDPSAAEPVEGTYRFIYNLGASCTGGMETTPGLVLSAAQEVSEPVEGLKANSKYTVCLLVEDTEGHAETSAHFETALPPETPLTEKPTAITATSATFHGEPNPLGEAAVGYAFTYGSDGSCEGASSTPVSPAKLKAATKVSTALTGLEAGSEYTVCLVATNEAGESATGAPQRFDTPAGKPVIASETASAINPEDAQLQAQVNPENQATRYHFEYATAQAKLGTSEAISFGEGTFPGVGEAQTAGPSDVGGGLTPSTNYFFRLVASNGTGVTDGPTEQFTTSPLSAPSIDEEHVSAVTQTDAELHALINPEDRETSYQFAIGTDTTYGLGGVLVEEGTIGAGFGDSEVTISMRPQAEGLAVDLQPNTEYHYEALAHNETGSSDGLTSAPGDQTFVTLPGAPEAATGQASNVTATSATLPATIDPLYAGHPAQDDTTYYFQYGGTTAYGEQTAPGDAGEGAAEDPVAVPLEHLEPGRTYHYRVVARNLGDATELNEQRAAIYGGELQPQLTYGEDEIFTTPSTPPLLTAMQAAATGQTTATITASLDPQGLATRYELQLGATQNALQPIASGQTSSPLPLSFSVGSLTAGTTYYYRIIAANADATIEPEGTFATPPGTPAAAAPSLPALIPYTPIAQITAKQEAENKQNSKPRGKPLTNRQKLAKALAACRRDKKKSGRTSCERAAHKRYPVKASKSAKRKS